jgi:hypothetical protein
VLVTGDDSGARESATQHVFECNVGTPSVPSLFGKTRSDGKLAFAYPSDAALVDAESAK